MKIYKSKLIVELEFISYSVPTQEDIGRISRMIMTHTPLDIVKNEPLVTVTSEQVEI